MKNIFKITLILLLTLIVGCSDDNSSTISGVGDRATNGYFEVIQQYSNGGVVLTGISVPLDGELFIFNTQDSIIPNGTRAAYTTGFYVSGFGKDYNIEIMGTGFNKHIDSSFTLPAGLLCNQIYHVAVVKD